jgi:hypothetical protein
LKEFIHGFDFVKMAPHPELILSTQPANAHARLLAEPGAQYAIYVQGGKKVELKLDVPVGEYRVQWVGTQPGVPNAGELVKCEGGLTVASPEYVDDIALKIVREKRP